MDRSRTMPRLCYQVTAALTLLGVILRTVCMLWFYDADPGYMTEGFFPTLSNLLYFILVIFVIVCVSLIPKGTLPNELTTPLRTSSAAVLGTSLALFAILGLIRCIPKTTDKFLLASALLGLASSIYYFISGKKQGRYPDWLSFLGYLPVFWCIAAVGDIYFDPFVTTNSPVKLSLQLALLGYMLTCLAELRFRIGRISPRYSAAFLAIGTYTCLVGAVPVLVATGAGILDHPTHVLCAAVLMCAGLYSLHLLYCVTCVSTDPTVSTDPPAPAAPQNTQ